MKKVNHEQTFWVASVSNLVGRNDANERSSLASFLESELTIQFNGQQTFSVAYVDGAHLTCFHNTCDACQMMLVTQYRYTGKTDTYIANAC